MTVEMFLGMLLVFSSVSSLFTQGIKKLLDKQNYASNIIALITSLVVGSAGMIIYYILTDATISSKEIVFIILMGLATWLASMLDYDKVRQCIEQLKGINKNE